MKIWGISRTLSNDLAEWPGDEPCCFRLTRQKAKGESINLGAIGMSVHNGTHADAQFHFDTNGESIEKAPLEIYLGRAAVVDLTEAFSRSKQKHLITVEDLQPYAEEIAESSRLLVKTGRWSDSTVFPNQIPVMAPPAPPWLEKSGARRTGLNVPSVVEFDSKCLQSDTAFAAAGLPFVTR